MDFDETRVTNESRRFAAKLFKQFPWFADHAMMETNAVSPLYELVVSIDSPTGDIDRKLTIWLAEGEPSVEFGPWHTHATLWAEADEAQEEVLFGLIQAILDDTFVLIENVGGEYDGHTGVLDLSDKVAAIEELTSEWSTGHVRVKSWSGAIDRELRLADLDQDTNEIE